MEQEWTLEQEDGMDSPLLLQELRKGVRRHHTSSGPVGDASAAATRGGQQSIGFNRSFFRRVRFLGSLYLYDHDALDALGHRVNKRRRLLSWRCLRVFLIFFLTLLNAIVQVTLLNPILGPFVQSIADGEQSRFFSLSVQGVALALLIGGLMGLVGFLGEQTALDWRKRIIAYSSEMLFRDGSHLLYRIGSANSLSSVTIPGDSGVQIDNSDQRIATATKDFTGQAVTIFLGGFSGVQQTMVLRIFTMLVATGTILITSGWLPALVLVLVILLAWIVIPRLMHRVSFLTFFQDRAEGSFRYRHSIVRTFAESISFMSSPSQPEGPAGDAQGGGEQQRPRPETDTHGEKYEHRKVNSLYLFGVRDNYHNFLIAQCFLDFATQWLQSITVSRGS